MRMVKLFVLIIGFWIVSLPANSQFALMFGAGFGFSEHADSYIEEEFFKTFQFSGFRPFLVEARLQYNLPTETGIFGAYQLSPATTVSPYRFSFMNVGLEQRVPGTPVIVHGAYGLHRSKTNIKMGRGNLWQAGLGLHLEILRINLAYAWGNLDNEQPYLAPQENRVTLMFLFSLYDPIYR